jgi:hypothetical protein
VEERFFSKVDGGSYEECWQWQGGGTNNGYGCFAGTTAHRWSWEFFNGPIPERLQIDHLCRNKGCVNPWHLDPVTAKVNVGRVPVWNRAGGVEPRAVFCDTHGNDGLREWAYGRACLFCNREKTKLRMRAMRARRAVSA